jgi:NADPH:quinone reductase
VPRVRAIQVSEFGGPEVLALVELPEPRPTGDLARIQVTAAGVNYADTHQAANDYLARQELPLVPGGEVAGVTDDGRRVVALVGSGGYAEVAVAHPATTFALPDSVDDTTALAMVVQGTTAWHMLRTCAHLEAGESVLVVSAAGGVGSLAVQLARAMGAGRVIGTASSPEKVELVGSLGADEVLQIGGDVDAAGVTGAVRMANGGKPVDVVLEMTGGPVFDGSLAALAPFGRLVTYGLASRVPPTPVEPGRLMGSSRAVLGFWLVHVLRRPGGLRPAMAELFRLHGEGRLRALDGGSYPLADARRAHEDLRSRRTHGKLTLDPTR